MAQTPLPTDSSSHSLPLLRVMSYNVENLFDTSDDPDTDDAAYLPAGALHWSVDKYRHKLKAVAQVISDLGQWEYPAIVGLIEVENSQVVSDLVAHRKLKQVGYRQAVSRAADPRGIDVALLWHPKYFRMVEAREIPHYGPVVSYPYRRDPRTKAERQGSGRNSLWVTLECRLNGALLDVFVVHLPSRRQGVRATDPKRIEVTQRLAQVIRERQLQMPDAKIVVMGDFNDNPSDLCISEGLGAIAPPDDPELLVPQQLYAIGTKLMRLHDGSHMHGGHPWLPDQFVLSGNLMAAVGQIRAVEGMRVHRPEYVTKGKRPYRSFQGTRYVYGYSDHYPVFFDLQLSGQ